MRVLSVKVGKKGVSPPFLSQLPLPCCGGYLGTNLLPCGWSWCLARSREKKPNPNQTMLGGFSSNLQILQKIKQWGPSLPQPFPCAFHQLLFLPISQLVGAQGWMPSTTPGFCWLWVYPGLVSEREEVPARLWLMTGLMLSEVAAGAGGDVRGSF